MKPKERCWNDSARGTQKRARAWRAAGMRWPTLALMAIGLVFTASAELGPPGTVPSLMRLGPNQASDENAEYLIDRSFALDGVKGRIDVGDSLRGMVVINTLNSTAANTGGTTGVNELTGVFQAIVLDKTVAADPDGVADSGDELYLFHFGPDPAFEADLSGGIGAPTGFVPGPGALVVLFEDAANDAALHFNDPAPAVPPLGPDDGTPGRSVPPSSADVSLGPYDAEEQFIATAFNGEWFWTLGFRGAPGEGWVANSIVPGFDRITRAFAVASGVAGASFNAGLSVLAEGPAAAGLIVDPITTSPFGGTVDVALSGQLRGVNDLDTPFEVSSNVNASFSLTERDEVLACRVTGGGVNESLAWDGTFAEGSSKSGRQTNRYQFGGQAGANTGAQPQPKGEWTHHQQRGPAGSFIFHAGTASAPLGTEIDVITCGDPGFCNPARPAPAKQIDFAGVGSFKNIRSDDPKLAGVVPGQTLHWFEVNIDDLGEPGKSGKQNPAPSCPAEGFGLNEVGDCGCADFYRIRIHASPEPGSPVIYEVSGYIDGGNLQIHPPTGFDQQ